MLFQYLKKGTVTYVTIIAQCLYWAFQGIFLKNAFSNTCSITSVTIIWYIKCSLVLCRKTVRQTNWYFYTILSLTEALDKNKKVRVVFGDISKAFDRVWHAGLLAKLNSTGVTGDLNKGFSSYLAGRKQRVVLDNINSDFLLIKAGVPQGSVLGPLLFLLYINDIADNLQCGISLFADDNIIFTSADTMDECTNALNKDLIEMENWAAAWLVTFSAKKLIASIAILA